MAPPHTAIRTGAQARETTETTGTGTFTLAGAVSGFQTLLAATAASAVVKYYARLRNGTEWEWGVGTLNAGGTTLARTTVLRSSNSGSAVNFSGGTKDIWIGPGPDQMCHVSASSPAVTDDNDGANGTFLPGSFWFNTTTDVLYFLADDSNGAAIWVPINKHAGNNAACSEKTIASGAITITDAIHRVDTESDAATDDLDTITLSTAADGSVVHLKAENSARRVIVTNAGNIVTPNARYLELSTKQYLRLVYNATDSKWIAAGGQGYQGFFVNTDGATVTFDIAKSRKHMVTLGGNRTLAISNDWDGAVFVIELESDGTGRTATWFSGITWAAGSAPTQTATANKSDCFIFLRRASGIYLGAVLAQNYSN